MEDFIYSYIFEGTSKVAKDAQGLCSEWNDREEKKFRQKMPTLIEILQDDDKLGKFLFLLSVLRLCYPFDLSNSHVKSPIAWSQENRAILRIGKTELYIAPVTESFRRHIIYTKDNRGNISYAIEIKMPGQRENRTMIWPAHYTIAKHMQDKFGENNGVVSPIFFISLKGRFKLYERQLDFTDKRPLGIAGFCYQDGKRYGNVHNRLIKDLVTRKNIAFTREEKEEKIRAAIDILVTVIRLHYLGYMGRSDRGNDLDNIENFRSVDETGRVVFVGDFGAFRYVERKNWQFFQEARRETQGIITDKLFISDRVLRDEILPGIMPRLLKDVDNNKDSRQLRRQALYELGIDTKKKELAKFREGAGAIAAGVAEPGPGTAGTAAGWGAGEVIVKAAANGALPKRTVIEEFIGKRHGGVVDWDAIRDFSLISLRNHFIEKGIKDLVFYGGVPRNAFLGLEIGKDYDLALIFKIDHRTKLEIEWKTLYRLLVESKSFIDGVDFAVKDWSEGDFLNGRDGYPGLTELENIMRRIKEISNNGMIKEELQPYLDMMVRYSVCLPGTSYDTLLDNSQYAAASDILYRYIKEEVRDDVYWGKAEVRIGEIEAALGFEQGAILDKQAYFEGRLLEVMAVMDDEDNLCPRPENKISFREGLQLTIETMGVTVDGQLFDPHNIGMEDLEKGILRFVSKSGAERYMNYQNVFRLVRFRLELGFDYDERTKELFYQFCKGIVGNRSSELLLEQLYEAEDFIKAYYDLEDVMKGIREKPEPSAITDYDKELVRQAKEDFLRAYLAVDGNVFVIA